MIWREPTNHATDCYFCWTKINGITKRTRSAIYYPDCPSAIRPVSHNAEIPVPLNKSKEPVSSEEEPIQDEEYVPSPNKNEPKKFTQAELNDLIRGLSLSNKVPKFLDFAWRKEICLSLEHRLQNTGFDTNHFLSFTHMKMEFATAQTLKD